MLCLCSSLRHPGDVRRHPDAPDARGGGTAAHGGQRQRGRGGIARLHGLHCVLFLFLDLNACHKVYAVSQAILQYHDHWFDIMGGGTTLPCSPGVSQRSFQLEVFSCCARAGSCQALGLSGNQTSNLALLTPCSNRPACLSAGWPGVAHRGSGAGGSGAGVARLLLRRGLLPDPVHLPGEQQAAVHPLYVAGEERRSQPLIKEIMDV